MWIMHVYIYIILFVHAHAHADGYPMHVCAPALTVNVCASTLMMYTIALHVQVVCIIVRLDIQLSLPSQLFAWCGVIISLIGGPTCDLHFSGMLNDGVRQNTLIGKNLKIGELLVSVNDHHSQILLGLHTYRSWNTTITELYYIASGIDNECSCHHHVWEEGPFGSCRVIRL